MKSSLHRTDCYFGKIFSNVVSVSSCLLLGACAGLSHPDSAPAIGAIGGVVAGAVIGSASGNAGTGAMIGSLVGQGTGEIVRNERAPLRTFEEDRTFQDLPVTLKAAKRFDASIVKESAALARRRATGNSADVLVVKAQARQRLQEIRGWRALLENDSRQVSRAIRRAETFRDPYLGELYQSKSQLAERLASLREHESWFKSLAS
jgi:Glycine zipper